MPKISVIMPVFNAEKYLNEALITLSKQTFNDFEIIAINDGSKDSSLSILNEYSKTEQRLIVLNQENIGITKTLNKGIELARGDYIARMDADDLCLPQRFEHQLKYIENNELDMCGTQFEMFGIFHGLSKYPINCKDCYLSLLLKNSFAHSSILIKKSVISKYKYNEIYKYSQDYDLWCRLAIDNVKMGNTPEVLIRFRTSEGQVSTANNKKQLNFAQCIAKSYWGKYSLTRDLLYPMCLLDSNNNGVNELMCSLNSLIELQKRIKNINFLNDKLNNSIFILLTRLSSYGLNFIKPYLASNNICKKERIILRFLAITEIMTLILYIKKRLPAKYLGLFKNIIRSYLCYFKVNE